MAPIIATAIQLLLPVAVNEVKKKLADEANVESFRSEPVLPKDISTVEAAPIALKHATVGLVKSKTSWFALALAAAGFLEQNQALLTSLFGSGTMGWILVFAGGASVVLRTITTSSIVDK